MFQFLSWIELISKHWRWIDTGFYGSLPWKPWSIFFIPKVNFKKIDKLNWIWLQVSTFRFVVLAFRFYLIDFPPQDIDIVADVRNSKNTIKKKYPKSPDFRKKVCLAQTWVKWPFIKKKKKKKFKLILKHPCSRLSPQIMYLLYVLHGGLPVDDLTIVNLKLASITALCSWSRGHFLVSIKNQKQKGRKT